MSEKFSSPNDMEGKHQKDGTITPVSRVTTVTSTNLFEDGTVDPVYQAKARVLNAAIQEIGMGKYQWGLFAVAGFGWFADSVWPLLGGLILSPVVNEFHFNGPFLSLALNIGLFVGAVFWGLGCDVWGRRWSFNITLFLAGVFGLAAGGSPDFITLASLLAVLGLGVGGNLPVDSAVFLDFVPGSHQYLLTILSIWWSVGQLVASFIAWPLIANFSCPQGSTTCTRGENMGWRYLLFTLGGMTIILWAIRLFVFPLYESPRFLVGIGRDAEAVEVVHRIAAYNRRTSNLSLLDLQAAAMAVGGQKGEGETKLLSRSSVFTLDHIKGLFATPKLAWSTSLLIFLWGIIGLASTLYNSFLPFLLASRGAQFGNSSYFTTYRNQVILGVIGVPGAFLAGWAVEQPYVGRKGTLALSAGLTGVFLFASTTARSSNALLGWNCGYAFCSNIMYGVLYALSPEVFPAKDRGTGNGLTATPYGIAALCTAVATEVTLSFSLAYYLHTRRSGVRRSDDIVTKLIALTITTGMLTTLTNFVDLIAYLTAHNNLYVLFFNFLLGKLYANAILTSLNSRGYVLGNGQGTSDHEAIRMPSMHIARTGSTGSTGGTQEYSGGHREIHINVNRLVTSDPAVDSSATKFESV